jgi:hypothetical protein
VLAEPALCILASGSKEVRLADEIFAYDPLNYLVFSVAMPWRPDHRGHRADPNLSMRINIDPAQLTALIAEAALGVPRVRRARMYVDRRQQLLDAVLRLARLLDSPKDIAMLAPLISREILYRLLRGPQGYPCMKLPWPTVKAIASARQSSGSTATTNNRCASMTWPRKSTSASRPCTTASRQSPP